MEAAKDQAEIFCCVTGSATLAEVEELFMSRTVYFRTPRPVNRLVDSVSGY